jgi:beta-ribofuranosylaminobenzene 5'-phosphate synthase
MSAKPHSGASTSLPRHGPRPKHCGRPHSIPPSIVNETGTTRARPDPTGNGGIVTCRVETGSRLHFGLLSVNNAQVPAFGGVGLMLDEPRGVVEVRRSEQPGIEASRELVPRVGEWLEGLARRDSRVAETPLAVRVLEEIPPHAGYGSGTQTSLALAEAVRRVCGLPNATPRVLARDVGRGKRSAIGVAGYELGGLIVDAGHRAGEPVGEIAGRWGIPQAWRVLLVESPRTEGLSGPAEGSAFDRLPPMPRATTDRLCALILLELLPALASCDCRRFVGGLVDYGRTVGDYFAREQGGTFASPVVARCDAALREADWPGLAQSSWGPTSATLVPNEEQAHRLAEVLLASAGPGEIGVRIVPPRNHGRIVCDREAE